MAGFRIHKLKSVDSTNSEAHRLHAAGEQGPLWIVAGAQTAGRGRLGRQWFSCPGNLYSTLLIGTKVSAIVASQLGIVIALAVAEAVDAVAGQPLVQLKWPNDCLIKGAKFCGILSEMLPGPTPAVAIGCGINVSLSPRDLAYPVTHVSAHVPVTIDKMFSAYSLAAERLVGQWDQGNGFSMLVEKWKSRAIGLGEVVEIHESNGSRRGLFQGLANDGAMVILENATTVRIYAGDVSIPSLDALRKAQA
jgi:BirA family transcriptional regulator, biotin operon repressor / biotin---[acetyl-CoA-carboxylase] ligase